MKKIVLFCLVSLTCLNGGDIKYDGEFAGKVDREKYTYEKKIKILKRIGIEYCIKGNDFYETRNDIRAMNHYARNFAWGHDPILPPSELKTFIDDRATINDKTIFNHYKNSNFTRFYTCLELYDSQEYHDEVERIVKKYCESCK